MPIAASTRTTNRAMMWLPVTILLLFYWSQQVDGFSGSLCRYKFFHRQENQRQIDRNSVPRSFASALSSSEDNREWNASTPSTISRTEYVGSMPELEGYLANLRAIPADENTFDGQDPLWEQIKEEATAALSSNPEAGPQLYTGILSQNSLLAAICTVIANEIATELIPATALKNLFIEQLTPEDVRAITFDLLAAATRSASVENAMAAILFHKGFHALVCYRLGHRLWLAGRTGLSYYMQSTVSRKYSADIHPAAKMGIGIHLRSGAGSVIGETAVVGNDCSILEGCTLGGTGKETGDRHPKLSDGVTILDGASILGNIPIGEGAIISSKSIVTKPVPALAVVGGVPAKVTSYRELTPDEFNNDLQQHLAGKYLPRWREIREAIENSPHI